jgi:phosphate transport system substrate-binding protein
VSNSLLNIVKKIQLPIRFVLLLLVLIVIQCGKSKNVKSAAIQIKGSDTMVNLVQAWVEEYKKVDTTVNIEVSGGGSGVGIAALERGAIDIATASRNIKSKEAEQVLKNTGKEPVEFIVAYDALAIYVHKDNPISQITFEQLAQIFGEGSKITRWSELGIKIPGVKNDKIIRISRQSSSGTYEFFREHVLHKKDFKLGSCDMNGSKEVVEIISSTKTAIGYSGMGYATSSIKMLNLIKKSGDSAYAPTVDNTLNGKYPLARSLQMYTIGNPEGAIKVFLDWVLSDAGQYLVQDNGFVPKKLLPALGQ